MAYFFSIINHNQTMLKKDLDSETKAADEGEITDL